MKPQRTLIIGDIHGNCDALNSALAVAKFDISTDRIICIGDYIDGWNQSFDVVRTLLEIQNTSAFENIFLVGNHDKWFIDILKNDIDNLRNESYIKSKYLNWYIQGGKQTLNSYLEYDDIFIQSHLENFFDQLKYNHIEDNKLFVHAGFNHVLGFHFTKKSTPHELLWNRSLYKEALKKFLINENLKKLNQKVQPFTFDTFDKIYIGHTPTHLQGFDEPVVMGNVINVDQGCKKRGCLTIWVDETNEYFQSLPI